MKRFPKAGLLIVTLVMPALIFVLLKLFATNHYNLPYLLPARSANGEVQVQNGDTIFSKLIVRCESLKQVDFNNALTVVHYLPQPCNETCQKAVDEVKRVAALKESIPELKVITVTTGNADAIKPEWKVLNAPGALDCLRSAGLLKVENGLILVDRGGFVRGIYKGGDSEETDRLMAEIKILDYEKKNEH